MVRAARFDLYGFYCVPGGFALVTRLERIGPDGAAVTGPARWNTGPRSLLDPADFTSLRRLINALRHADPGRYRAIVFHVASRGPVIGGGDLPDVTSAPTRLTEPYRGVAFGPNIAVRALVYEFSRPAVGQAMQLVPSGGSRLSGSAHLRSAGIRL